MKILILDDDYNRLKTFRRKLIGHEVVCTTVVSSTISHLESGKWDFLFLDHDLGGQAYVPSGPKTGYEVAQWLAANPGRQPENIIIHSFNGPGAKSMKDLLPKAVIAPGIWDKIQL